MAKESPSLIQNGGPTPCDNCKKKEIASIHPMHAIQTPKKVEMPGPQSPPAHVRTCPHMSWDSPIVHSLLHVALVHAHVSEHMGEHHAHMQAGMQIQKHKHALSVSCSHVSINHINNAATIWHLDKSNSPFCTELELHSFYKKRNSSVLPRLQTKLLPQSRPWFDYTRNSHGMLENTSTTASTADMCAKVDRQNKHSFTNCSTGIAFR